MASLPHYKDGHGYSNQSSPSEPTGSGSGPGSTSPGGPGPASAMPTGSQGPSPHDGVVHLSPTLSSTSPGADHKGKRRPHTKSRTGCVTCKKRRVKCDESRPVCRNCQHLRLTCQYLHTAYVPNTALQMAELRLLHHYIKVVAQSIADAGISNAQIWINDVPELAFKYPFLMHAVLMLSATHLSQEDPKTWENCVVMHRSESLRLLRHEVQHVRPENLDALVAASVLMILDAMANAALPSEMTLCALPASTWLHHVRGAATILLAVGVLPPTSKFYSFMGIDLLDLANTQVTGHQGQSTLECFDPVLRDLYPVLYNSPYYPALAYLDKVHEQRQMSDFILRVFAFPALLDSPMVELLSQGDQRAQRIVSSYYNLVRSYCQDMRESVWFLRGVAKVLPIDMDKLGGLGFVTSALPVSQTVESILARFDASFSAANNEAEAMMAAMMNFGADDMPENLMSDHQDDGSHQTNHYDQSSQQEHNMQQVGGHNNTGSREFHPGPSQSIPNDLRDLSHELTPDLPENLIRHIGIKEEPSVKSESAERDYTERRDSNRWGDGRAGEPEIPGFDFDDMVGLPNDESSMPGMFEDVELGPL